MHAADVVQNEKKTGVVRICRKEGSDLVGNNRASATVEAVVIMIIYMAVIAVVIRAFFVLERSVYTYCDSVKEDLTIEETVRSMRRTQWLQGKEE